MATVRFSMAEVASKVLGVEAVVKAMAEIFGQKPAMKTSRFEKQREAVWKREIKKLQSESQSLDQWTANYIIPQAGRYQSLIIDHVKHAFTVYSPEEAARLSIEMNGKIEKIIAQVNVIRLNLDKMNEARRTANELTDERSIIQAYHRNVAPYMEVIRTNTQKLSTIIN
ncbi:hypothetical protein [Parabacteroides pacaensis]|uniref:hypothetical protein n=1 Tax=Parabacteroides pacaensis TaxID=2086575 RepID=UPI00131A9282|nr:hypothetical protein [Parabacteroides pacaensis]